MKETTLNLSKLIIGMLFAINLYLIYAEVYAHAQQQGYITGKITYQSNGRCADGLWVEIYFGGSLKGRSLTGDDGRYLIAGLTPGGYELVVKRGMNVLLRQNIRIPVNRYYDIQLH